MSPPAKGIADIDYAANFADFLAAAALEPAPHLGAGTDHNIFTQSWMTLSFIPTGPAQGHTMIKRAVIAYFCGFTDNDTHAMIDKETAAYFCARMDLDACKETAKVRCKATQEEEFVSPEPVSETIEPDRM